MPLDTLEKIFERLDAIQPKWKLGNWSDCTCSIFDRLRDPSWEEIAQEQAGLVANPNIFDILTSQPPVLQWRMADANGSLAFDEPDDPRSYFLRNIGATGIFTV